MATINDPSFRFATNVFDTDGTDKVYNISFDLGYIDPAYVVALSGIEDPDTGLITGTTAHTVVFIDTPAGNRVKVTPVPATGRKLIIMRQTDISKLLVQFQDGKLQTGRNLDLNSTQLIMAIQEILDGLRDNKLLTEAQIGTVVDLSKVINEIYIQVLQLLASGGIVSVDPRIWSGAWTGDTETDAEFPLSGADVTGAGFYDTYVNGVGMEPNVDYQIIVAADTTQSAIRFLTVPAPGSTWFTVLRGYAKPYTGPAPITESSLRVPILTAAGVVFYAEKSSEFAQVRCTNAAGCNVTVNAIPTVGDSETKLGTGSFFSFTQRGAAPVYLMADAGVTFEIPGGCAARTRALNATITATCQDGDANIWLLSGDLAKEA